MQSSNEFNSQDNHGAVTKAVTALAIGLKNLFERDEVPDAVLNSFLFTELCETVKPDDYSGDDTPKSIFKSYLNSIYDSNSNENLPYETGVTSFLQDQVGLDANVIPALRFLAESLGISINLKTATTRKNQDAFWYASDDIYTLLKVKRQKHHGTNVTIGSIVLATNQSNGHNQLVDSLQDLLGERKSANEVSPQNQNTPPNSEYMVPINVNKNHWELLYFKVDKNNKVNTVHYFDPFGNRLPLSTITALKTVFGEGIAIQSLTNKEKIQIEDTVNCGPWIVEMAECIFTNKSKDSLARIFTSTNISKARKEQVELLRDSSCPDLRYWNYDLEETLGNGNPTIEILQNGNQFRANTKDIAEKTSQKVLDLETNPIDNEAELRYLLRLHQVANSSSDFFKNRTIDSSTDKRALNEIAADFYAKVKFEKEMKDFSNGDPYKKNKCVGIQTREPLKKEGSNEVIQDVNIFGHCKEDIKAALASAKNEFNRKHSQKTHSEKRTAVWKFEFSTKKDMKNFIDIFKEELEQQHKKVISLELTNNKTTSPTSTESSLNL